MSESNKNPIRYSIFVFLSGVILIVLLILRSDYFQDKVYLNARNQHFEGIVMEKFNKNKTVPFLPAAIYLASGRRLDVNKGLFNKLQVGDFIVKPPKTDSIYFYTQEGLVVIDENRTARENFNKRSKY